MKFANSFIKLLICKQLTQIQTSQVDEIESATQECTHSPLHKQN